MRSQFGLNSQELAQYKIDGFLVRRNVFSAEEIAQLQLAAERATASAISLSRRGHTYYLDARRFVDVDYLTIQFEQATASQAVRVIEPVHQLDDQFESLVDDERILDPMKSILGISALSLWTAKLNLKRPKEGAGFGWHQDSPYWIHDSDHVDLLPNVLVTLDGASEHNGCLRIIRGSHKQGCLPGISDGSQLGGFFTDPDCYQESDEVLMAAPAGALIFFDPHSIHGSRPNLSDQPRRALIITYQPAGFPMLKSGQERAVG